MLIFGIDGGIASIGWAVLDIDDATGAIIAAGSRGFDPPETDKERTPTNAVRRLHRGQRRVIRRRRQRMTAVRGLLHLHGLLPDAAATALRLPGIDPWSARAAGLDTLLNADAFAVAIGHVARHRGFRSNSKRDGGANAAPDTSAMLKAIEATRERLAGRTLGEMFARDPEYAGRKRNRSGDYSHTARRDDLEYEIRALFAAQRRLGAGFATAELEAAFIEAAFTQRPLQDSEHMLATCRYEPTQKRTARRSRSFELFRLLSRLAAMRLTTSGSEPPRKLSPAETGEIAADFGLHRGIDYRAVRKRLDLAPATRFADVAPEDEKRDIVARTGKAAEGTFALRKVLGPSLWQALLHRPALLDRIAEVLTFRESPESIRAGLEEAGAANGGLESLLVDQLMEGVEEGAFAAFSGAGHISAVAARAMLPHLARGLGYSEAAAEAGYDHAAHAEVSLDDVRNPVARRALGEMVKQVRALVHQYGLPARMHVELARDVGKSAEERDEITRGLDKRNKERDRARARYAELLGAPPRTADDMLRFELWEEQNGRCLYSGEAISPAMLRASDNSVQIDHILPWSRFGDDSFANKTLCLAQANQRKRNRTPWEWFAAERPGEWDAFEREVEGCAMKGRKKRGFYLRRNAAEVEEAFRNRNLGDTRYATRLLMDLLRRMYPEGCGHQVLARPGMLTAKLRRAWGLEGLKKAPDGKRLEDDRHHALDAIVLAATSEKMLGALTLAFQQARLLGLPQEFKGLAEPWPGFRDATHAMVASVFVSRSEIRRRARGKAHDATIKQVKIRDGKEIVYVRKAIDKLTLPDLADVKDAARQAGMIEALRRWIDAGRPKDRLPRFPKLDAESQADIDAAVAAAFGEDWRDAQVLSGAERREARRLLRRRFETEHPATFAELSGSGTEADLIRSVRVASRDKVAVPVRGGTADRGDMVRVDVFRKADGAGRGRFHLVPVYPHQVADRLGWPTPPDRAVVAYKPEAEWTAIDASFEFLFSLYPNSLVEITKPDREVFLGYFKGVDRSTAAISVADPESQQRVRSGIGSKTLPSFRKLAVDRLGGVSVVPREARTWHGVVCT